MAMYSSSSFLDLLSEKMGDIELHEVALEGTKLKTKLPSSSVVHQEEDIETPHGMLHVAVEGNRSKMAILTYHDIGLNYHSCFQHFFNYPDMQLLLQHFCVYHVNAPGQEEGAMPLPEAYQYPTMDKLAEMLTSVLDYYNLKRVIGFGIGAGANILSRFALMYPKKVDSLVLVNCSASQAGWTEWGFQKLNSWYLKGGQMTHFCEDYLLWHWFGNETMTTNADLVHEYLDNLKKINPYNLALFTEAYIQRTDLGIVRELDQMKKKDVKNFSCNVLLAVGDRSAHIDDVVAMNGRLDPTNSTWMEIYECGGMVFDEQPEKISDAFRFFLQGMGYVPTISHAKIAASRQSMVQSLAYAQEVKH